MVIDLGRHVQRRAAEGLHREPDIHLGFAEVAQLIYSVGAQLGNEDVVRLDVAVRNLSVAQTAADITSQLNNLLLCHRLAGLDQLRQGAQLFHADEHVIAVQRTAFALDRADAVILIGHDIRTAGELGEQLDLHLFLLQHGCQIFLFAIAVLHQLAVKFYGNDLECRNRADVIANLVDIAERAGAQHAADRPVLPQHAILRQTFLLVLSECHR